MDAPPSTGLSGPAPEASRPPRFTGRLVVGLTIIVLGVLFLLDALDVPGIGDVWHHVSRMWPIVFILIGIAKFPNCRSVGQVIACSIWILVGALLLASNYDLLTFSVWRLFWPAIIILVGISMVARAGDGRSYRRRRRLGLGIADDPGLGGPADTESRMSSFALWSGSTRRVATPDFQGGDATAIMGGCEIDLRQCNLASGPAVFDAFALMGGIELHVPGDWTVRNEGVAILGAIEDNRKETAGNPNKVLVIRGAAIMGGIELKN